MLIFIRFYWFDQNNLLKQIQFFLRICPFSNMVRKTHFLSISVLISEIVTFMSKRIVLYDFLQKCFKTTESHSLTVFGLLCGVKQFLLIFILFYWFDQKQLLKQIQIFLRIFHYSNMVRKTYFLCISVLVSEVVTFMSKKNSSLSISPKMLKTTERHSLAICGLLCGEKKFLLIFIRFYWLDQKKLLKQSKFSSGFSSFQTW